MDDNRETQALEKLKKLRPHFSEVLSSVSLERFLRGAWGIRALQSDNIDPSLSNIVGYPGSAITSDISSDISIRPWEIETLINELLCNDLESLYQSFSAQDWSHWAYLITHLRRLENEESAYFNNPEHIIDHLFHIASRQFEWQEGLFNKSEIFRGIFIYGQGDSASYFEDKFSLSINDLFATGFALASQFLTHHRCSVNLDCSILGITPVAFERSLNLLSRDSHSLTSIARSERDLDQEIAFKPSVLRLFPCIRAGFRNRYLYCPLPELIIKRISTGIFYDVVDGGHSIREDYGRRFEDYVHLLVSSYQPELRVEREFTYRTKSGEIRSPDLFIYNSNGKAEILIECKATRMPLKTRYSYIHEGGKRGYEEMVKAVFQIWRHAYHSRLGLTEDKLAKDPVGIVLTLDSWFQGAIKRQQWVLEAARTKFAERFPEASIRDQIPVTFAHMTEFEGLLRQGNPKSIFEAVSECSKEERVGWSLHFVHSELVGNEVAWADFPFEDQLHDLLPFWRDLASRAEVS